MSLGIIKCSYCGNVDADNVVVIVFVVDFVVFLVRVLVLALVVFVHAAALDLEPNKSCRCDGGVPWQRETPKGRGNVGSLRWTWVATRIPNGHK